MERKQFPPQVNYLIFVLQNLEYKFVDLLSCHLEKASNEVTQAHVTQRFNYLRNKNTVLQARLEDVFSVVRNLPMFSTLLLGEMKKAESMGHACSN